LGCAPSRPYGWGRGASPSRVANLTRGRASRPPPAWSRSRRGSGGNADDSSGNIGAQATKPNAPMPPYTHRTIEGSSGRTLIIPRARCA
jgi:hypothetical protein